MSVLDEVLRGQARHRRLRRAGLAVLLLAVFAALWLGRTGAGDASGTVIGYVPPCSGTGSTTALVEALPGRPHSITAADGSYWVVVPAMVASRARVSQNHQFRLDDLAPGQYVILAQYAGITMSTYADVPVAPGQVVTAHLPDTCR